MKFSVLHLPLATISVTNRSKNNSESHKHPSFNPRCCFQRRPKGISLNDYYISSDVSRFILSHTNLIHLGATIILQKNIPQKTHKNIPQKNPTKSCIKISCKKLSSKKNSDPAIFILPLPNIPPSFSHQFFFPHPFYAAQFIFPTYIELLVSN